MTRHWSGKHRKTVRGINLITLLWTDDDRKIPCDYRLYSKTDGKTVAEQGNGASYEQDNGATGAGQPCPGRWARTATLLGTQ